MAGGGIHFISGLPRSGSTLLSAILKQNPRFHANVTSPMLWLTNAVQPAISTGEFVSFFDDARRAAILKGLFASYYSDMDGRVVFDTNRLWTGRLALVQALYPGAKVICCVRHVGWILDSFERAFRRNPLRTAAPVGYQTQPSIHARMEALANGDSGVVGLAWNALRDAWHGDQAGMLIVIDYDRLTADPAGIIDRLYTALGEAPFTHDFNALDYDEPEYDAANGMPGLHKVRPKVERLARETCLPPELFQKYDTEMFWRAADAGNRGAVIL